MGSVNISNVVWGPFCSGNVGYWVDQRLNGRGIATIALGQVIGLAFGQYGLHRLEAGTLPENTASQRVLERCGFRRIGLSRGHLRIAGAWRDHVLYSLVAPDEASTKP